MDKNEIPLSELQQHELDRLRDCERAWFDCFDALIAGNPEAFSHPSMVGRECALAEIRRLQTIVQTLEASRREGQPS